MRPSVLEGVIDREIAALAAGDARAHVPLMIWGPPGVGKSRIVADAAARAALPVIDIRLAQMEPTDLRGIPFRDGGAVVWAIPRLLPDAARHGPRGVLFLDEITSAVPTVTAAAYQLILDRRLGDYQVPHGWMIVAAGNRHGDRGVTFSMPAPLANRFAHYELEPDVDDWADWACHAGLDARIVAFLRFRPDLLFQFEPSRETAAFPSPRTWEFVHRALRTHGSEPGLLREAVQACVGQVAGAAFMAWLRHVESLPDPATLLEHPDHPLPAGVELEYAVAQSLIHHLQRQARPVSDDSAARVLAIARRLAHREIGAMLVSGLHRILDRPLLDVPGFGEWAIELRALRP